MHKRGFQNRWENRHWRLVPSGYQRGQTDKNIPAGGSGASPNYFSIESKGRGWYEDDDGNIYQLEKVYVSSPLIDDLGVYRVGVLYRRLNYLSDKCTAYTFIAECTSNGKIKPYGYSDETSLDHTVFEGTRGKGWCIHEETGLTWATVLSTIPLITMDGIDLTVGGTARKIYKQIKDTWTQNFTFRCMVLSDATEAASGITSALTITTTTPSANDICERMSIFKGDWVYWYGGSGQIANESLLASLAKSYPNVYTASYIQACKADINGHTRVADCSYAVSYAYNIGRTNSTWFLNNYATWTGEPKNGMFLARNGHVGIYQDGHTMEMANQKDDYKERQYVPAQWTRVGYDPNREY